MAGDDARPEELLRVNRLLDEQVKTLVKIEQRFFQSERALGRRNTRLDALNQFALDCVELSVPQDIFSRAAEVLFSVFALDQAVGFLATPDGSFVPVMSRGAELGRLNGERVLAELPAEALIDRVDALRSRPGLTALFEQVDRIFADASQPFGDPGAPGIIVPLARESGRAAGLLVFVRLSATVGYHEELPTQADLGFIGVVARLAAASVTNVRLVQDLKVSYERLEKAQRDLVERERLAALGEFSAVVAHEVRNPLGAIFNAVAMLRRKHLDGETSDLVQIVAEESDRLDRIVVDLIDFAQPIPARLRPERPLHIVESALEGVRTVMPAGLVSIIADANMPEVLADARLLRQGIVNLLLNAVQASGDARPIVVRLATESDGRAMIAVEDRGAGIPAGLAERIFEPFFTTKATGTGLGLSVVKRVADSHNGTIDVAARIDGGTVFTLRLNTVAR